MKRVTWIVLLVVAGVWTSGCVVVRPWERERLAKRVMSRGDRVEEAMCERTFLEAREGASGGSAVGAGGGCACN
jgi:hypothetical protein